MGSVVYLHIICAFLSLILLVVRGGMQLNGHDWRAVKLLKILPHLTDTLLILSGLILVFGLGYGFPWWVILKFVLLGIYVVFSTKFFSKTVVTPNKMHFGSAVASLSGAILLGYLH